MSPQFGRTLPSLLLALLLTPAAVPAADANQEDEHLLKEVSRRLLAVTIAPPGHSWPPDFKIEEQNEVNASACGHPVIKDGSQRVKSKVVVFRGLMRRVVRTQKEPTPEDAAHRLAFILGHELGHVLLGHVETTTPGGTGFGVRIFTREQEIAADQKGLELLLKAGYSRKRALASIQRFKDLGLDYSSFEGLKRTHPSWDDRRARLEQDDAFLWRAMGAFHSGVDLLALEQYASAAKCFEVVIEEFPNSPEAWSNLGYSRLMLYYDKMTAKDLAPFKVGQVATGGFYNRSAALVQVKGIDHKLWNQAVESLKEARLRNEELRLKGHLIKANLGLAYLLSPGGPQLDEARPYLKEAADEAVADLDMDPLARAAVLINAGVADLRADEPESGADKFMLAEADLRRAVGSGAPRQEAARELADVLRYNRGLMRDASKEPKERRRALTEFEEYLLSANPTSAWYVLAFEKYVALCRDLAIPPRHKNREGFVRQPEEGTALRPVTSITLPPEVVIPLSLEIDKLPQDFKTGRRVPVVGDELVRLRYADQGMDLLATDRVQAIFLRGPSAPAIPLTYKGGAAAGKLRVGMTRSDFENLLKGESPSAGLRLDDPNTGYLFYRRLGLGARFLDHKVVELVIAQPADDIP